MDEGEKYNFYVHSDTKEKVVTINITPPMQQNTFINIRTPVNSNYNIYIHDTNYIISKMLDMKLGTDSAASRECSDWPADKRNSVRAFQVVQITFDLSLVMRIGVMNAHTRYIPELHYDRYMYSGPVV